MILDTEKDKEVEEAPVAPCTFVESLYSFRVGGWAGWWLRREWDTVVGSLFFPILLYFQSYVYQIFSSRVWQQLCVHHV